MLDRRLVASLLLGMMLLTAPRAHAEDNDDGDSLGFLFEVESLYEEMEYEQALEQVRNARSAPLVKRQQQLLFLYEGVILFEMGDQTGATNAFRSALLMRLNTRIPMRVAPKIEEHFESVRQQVSLELESLASRNAEGVPLVAQTSSRVVESGAPSAAVPPAVPPASTAETPPPPSFVQPPPAVLAGTVSEVVLEINRLYEDMEYETAIVQARSARGRSIIPRDALLLSLYEGILLSEMGQHDLAGEAFRGVFRAQPDTRLPVRVSPKITAHFEAVRQQVKSELLARVVEEESEDVSTPSLPGTGSEDEEGAPVEGVDLSLASGSPSSDEPLPPAEEPTSDRVVSQAQVLTPEAPAGPVGSSLSSGELPPGLAAALAQIPVREVPPPKLVSPLVPSEVSGRRSPQAFPRALVLVPAIAGTTLIAMGGVSFAFSQKEMNRLNDNDPPFKTLDEVRKSVAQGRSWQTVGVGLMTAGLTAVAVSAGVYVLSKPNQPISLGISTTGNSAIVYGRWP